MELFRKVPLVILSIFVRDIAITPRIVEPLRTPG